MKKALALVCLSAVALVAVIYVGYRTYERKHISSDLRRTLNAAVDPSCPVADERTYLRDARVQIRTERDAELLAIFQTAVREFEASQDATERLSEIVHRQMNRSVVMTRLANREAEYVGAGIAPPSYLLFDAKELYGGAKNDDAQLKLARAQHDTSMQNSQKSYAALRAALGLPVK